MGFVWVSWLGVKFTGGGTGGPSIDHDSTSLSIFIDMSVEWSDHLHTLLSILILSNMNLRKMIENTLDHNRLHIPVLVELRVIDPWELLTVLWSHIHWQLTKGF